MNSKEKQSTSPTGNGSRRKVRIGTYFFSKWLVIVPQPYAVDGISAYTPCHPKCSLNTKCVCFSHAFEAHSDTVHAHVRQEEGLPADHITGCTTAFLDS